MCLNQLSLVGFVNFITQVAYVYIYNIRVGVKINIPHVHRYRCPRYHLVLIS
jgi:hypothetical protein